LGERDLGEASGSPWPSFAPPRPLPTIKGAVRVARNYGLDVHGTVWLPARSAARSARSAGSRILRLRHRAQPGKQLTLPLQPRPAGHAHQPRAEGSQIRHHQANRYTMNQQAENAQAKAL
jgi:hypothetical protein